MTMSASNILGRVRRVTSKYKWSTRAVLVLIDVTAIANVGVYLGHYWGYAVALLYMSILWCAAFISEDKVAKEICQVGMWLIVLRCILI